MDKKAFEKGLREYDKSVSTDGQNQLIKTAMLVGSQWEKHHGPSEGIFTDRPRGHRCLWSCVWSTSKGSISPNTWMPLETLLSQQIIYEALDVIARTPLDFRVATKLTPLLMGYLFGDELLPAGAWLERIKTELHFLRDGYPQFSCSWDPIDQERLIHVIARPGWNTVSDFPRRVFA